MKRSTWEQREKGCRTEMPRVKTKDGARVEKGSPEAALAGQDLTNDEADD